MVVEFKGMGWGGGEYLIFFCTESAWTYLPSYTKTKAKTAQTMAYSVNWMCVKKVANCQDKCIHKVVKNIVRELWEICEKVLRKMSESGEKVERKY